MILKNLRFYPQIENEQRQALTELEVKAESAAADPN
jgi:hypothetical protein